MGKPLIDRLASLLTVKSIVTLSMTVTFVVLCLRAVISGQDFMTVFLMVISFYFGTQHEKKQSDMSGTATQGEAVDETTVTGFGR